MTDNKIASPRIVLDRTITELKSSVRLFISASRGESNDLDRLLDAMVNQIDTEAATYTFSQLVGQFKQRRDLLLRNNSEEAKQRRIELISLIKDASSKEISTTQVDLLNNLADAARNDDISNEDLLIRLGDSLLAISDDIELSRKAAHKVVDNEHKHIKQNKANVVASDIQTASRRLARELLNLSNKLSKDFPNDVRIEDIKTKAESLKSKNNQFFRSLDLLQELNRHVSNLISKERLGAQEMLIGIQSKILDMFQYSSDLESSFDQSSENSSSLDKAMKSRMDSLKRQAESSDNIEDLQAIVGDSIKSLADTMETFSERQKKIDQKNKAKIRTLTGELEEAKKQLSTIQDKLENKEEESLVDPLSQLGNRKGYVKKMKEAYEKWKKGNKDLSIVVLDIDRFKSINDKYGHSVGDQIIRKIGSIVKESIRETDYSARYGGEEFVIICENTGLLDAARLCEKIRLAICRKKFRLRDSTENLTISSSFGVAEFTPQRKEIMAVFNAADKAMYEAKKSGRNKCVAAHNNKLITITKDKKNAQN